MNVKVDKYRLEDEAAEQPELLHEATKNLFKLYEKKKTLSNKLNELESDLFIKIKMKPKKYFGKLDKAVTDTSINRMINTLKEVKQLKRKVIKAESKFLKAQNHANVIESRKSMIKYMEELYMADYWSINRVSDDDANMTDFREAKRKLKDKNSKKKKRRERI